MITWIMFLGVFLALAYAKPKKIFSLHWFLHILHGKKKCPKYILKNLLGIFWDIIIIPEDDLWLLVHVGCFGTINWKKVLYLTGSTVLLLSNNIIAGPKENYQIKYASQYSHRTRRKWSEKPEMSYLKRQKWNAAAK